MNLVLDPNKPTLHQQSLIDDLHRLNADALRLRSLAYKAGLLAMATGLDLPDPGGRRVEIRRVMREVQSTLTDLREAEASLLPRVSPDVRKQIAAALSPIALRPFEQFLAQLGQINDRKTSRVSDTQEGRSELYRFICVDLEQTLETIEQAVVAAQKMARSSDIALAFADTLTGLPNRRALYRMVDERWSEDGANRPLALLRLDVELFDRVHDNFGHEAGNFALQRAAGIIRATLGSEDFAARMGGEEFVIALIGDLPSETVAERARTLISRISEPFDYQGQPVTCRVSIGVVTLQRYDRASFDRVLQEADLALRAAKSDDRAQVHFFTPNLRTRDDATNALTSQMRAGMARGEFAPYFQPQVDGRTGALVGFEALARWNHPERGLLTPYHFHEVAVQNGLLEELDTQINQAVIDALKGWRESGFEVPRVSINISAERLTRRTLGKELADLVTKAGMNVESFGVEIRESAMIEEGSLEMIETVKALSNAGFQVELDAFGTGQASIANLHHFKVNRIKIDRSFIKDIHLHANLSKITAAMIDLAHSLDLVALAEGVEIPEERFVLNDLGIDHIQGFGVSRPMPKGKVEGWIRQSQRKPTLPRRPLLND